MMFFRFAWSWLLHTWARHLGWKTLAEPRVVEERWRICQTCEFYDAGQCRVCGCLLLAKNSLALEQCPKKFWLRVWQKSRTNT